MSHTAHKSLPVWQAVMVPVSRFQPGFRRVFEYPAYAGPIFIKEINAIAIMRGTRNTKWIQSLLLVLSVLFFLLAFLLLLLPRLK